MSISPRWGRSNKFHVISECLQKGVFAAYNVLWNINCYWCWWHRWGCRHSMIFWNSSGIRLQSVDVSVSCCHTLAPKECSSPTYQIHCSSRVSPWTAIRMTFVELVAIQSFFRRVEKSHLRHEKKKSALPAVILTNVSSRKLHSTSKFIWKHFSQSVLCHFDILPINNLQ